MIKPYLTELVRRRRRCDYLEIRIEEASGTRVRYTGRQLEEASEHHNLGGNVRVLIGGGWGFASFTNMDELESKIKEAINLARSAATVVKKRIRLAPVTAVEDHVPADIRTDPRTIPIDKKVHLCAGYNDLVMGYHPKIASSNVIYSDSFLKKILATSEGTYIEQEKLDITLWIKVVAKDTGHSQLTTKSYASDCDYAIVLQREDEIRDVCKLAVDLLDAVPVRGGTWPVIIDPVLTGVFIHEAFGHLSEADRLYDNPSLQEMMKLGSKFGGKLLNVYDSGIEKGFRGCWKYDDEGVPMEKTYIIKEGKLVGRLHSRISAGMLKESPTGNARAVSFKYPPIPRMRVTCVEGGDSPPEEMFREVKEGIYAKGAVGGQTGGEMFTFIAESAHIIRDGKVCELVRDVSLTGNVFSTLRDIIMVGNDFRITSSGGGCGKGVQWPLPVSEGGPHLLIRNVIVGGKS